MLNGKRYFLVGIGGSGMLPLATILAGRGAIVAGSDRSLDAGRTAAKFDGLRALGVELFAQDGSGVVSPDQIVVASAAVEASVPDLVRAAALGCARMTRAELNAALFNDAAVSIGVAGTSGKSTVTGMIATILRAAGRDPTVMNGATMLNTGTGALVGGDDAFVSEVDESDGSIALYRPSVAVLNNVSRDHKELGELRELFGGFLARGGTAVVNAGDAEAAALAPAGAETLALGRPADLWADGLTPEPHAVGFDLIAGDERHRVRLAVPGAHNVANALCAVAACIAAGVPLADAARHIEGYAGIRRRFEWIGEANGVTVIDDFGHNPDKIAATLATLRAFPGRLLILFQPHGYGPLRQLRAELAEAFAAGLDPQDLLVLPDPVYHGGTVTRDVGSDDLATDIRAGGRDARYVADREAAAALLVGEACPGDRVIVMGARDDTLGELARRMLAALGGRDTIGGEGAQP